MIKPLYKSFIPYLVLLILILIVVSIFDRYAERISNVPELIQLSDEEETYDSTQFSWQLDSEIALRGGSQAGRDTLYAEAMELFRKQQYRKAGEKVTVLLDRAPHLPDAWNLRALILVSLQEYHEAEDNFYKALEHDPGFTEARINLASLYMKMLRLKEAETQYELALHTDPNNPAIYYNLGMLYAENSQTGPAGDAFMTAANFSSGKMKSKALCQLGMVLLTKKDTLAARENLNEAILLNPRNEMARLQLALTFSDAAVREAELQKIYSLNPASFQANYYLGNLYSQAGPPSKAEYHYRKALEKHPNNEKVMKELGNLLISQQRMKEAELVLSGFTAGDTLPQAYFYQAKMAAENGNTGEAVQLYTLAVEKAYNNYPEAYLNMAILYKEQKKFDKAIENYRNAIGVNPQYSLAYYNLALLYTDLDSTEKAIESYLESIRFDPQAVKSWYNLGRIYDDLEDTGRAIDAYQHAHQIDPGYTRAMLALGNAYLGSESYLKAIDQYRELLAMYPNYSKAWFNLGLAYTRQENPREAMEAFEKLIEVDPDNVRARINLASLYSLNDEANLAISVLKDAMYIEMDNPEIRFNLAFQYHNQGQTREAIHQLIQVIQLDAGYRKAYAELLSIYNELGDDLNYEIIKFRQQKEFFSQANFYESGKNLLELGEPGLALESFDLARKNGDDRTWLYYWTGKAHLDLFEVEEAIRWFNLTLEKDPLHKFTLYRMGQALEMLGEPAKAASYYTTLLELDHEFKIVHKTAISTGEG